MTRILIPYYSAYGHIYDMAKAVCAGVESVSGTEVQIVKIPEFAEVQERFSAEDQYVQAAKKQAHIREVTLADLEWADGFIWGVPTRFGSMPAQMKHFLESANDLWFSGALESKPFGVFVSTGHIHGGQETTVVTTLINLIHFGMIFVGLPPQQNKEQLTTEAIGGSCYGAATIAGVEGQRQPEERELRMGFRLGARVAEVSRNLRTLRKAGR